jgi:hypothetical protein
MECTEYASAIAITAAGLAASTVPYLALITETLTGVRVLDLGDLGHRRIVAHHFSAPGPLVALGSVPDQLRRRPVMRK